MSIKKATQLIGLFSLFMMGILAASQPAAAEENMWMRWDVIGDFTIGEPDVRLIVETGFYDEQGEWQQVGYEETPLICEVNNVEFNEGEAAIFDGQGYIACQMVNVLEIAAQLPGGSTALPEEMGGSGTFVEAELTATEYGYDNPIFYHPDIQFNVPNVGEAYLTLEVGDLAAKSGGFSSNQEQFVRGELGESGDYKVHHPTFVAGKESLESDPPVLYGAALVSNVYEGTIYIGYSPKTDTFFKGELYRFRTDPGCSGYG